ncbi:hypothetical protein Tco_1549503 [Tanacetum coccineum]
MLSEAHGVSLRITSSMRVSICFYDVKPYREGFEAFAWQIPILITVSKTVLRHSKLFKGFKVQLGEYPIQAQRGGLRAGGEAYGGEPSVDLLRSFLNIGRAGDWLTLSSRFPELLLEDNKFDKKSFKDKIPLFPQMDPLYDQITTYPCNVQTFPDPILYLAGQKTSWKYSPKKHVIYHRRQEMDFRSFMIQGVDGEFNFLPEEGLDKNRSSIKFVNNEAPVINAEPISIVHPSNIIKNIVDSHNISSDEGGLSLIGLDAPSYLEEGKRLMISGKRKVAVGSHREGPHQKAQKVLAQASKVAGDASSPLDVDSDPDIYHKLDPSNFPSAKELKDVTDCHWVIAHVTPPSWKQYLRGISIEQLCDIHDKAYIRQAILDNVLNGRTQELISALHKARVSCDTMREWEIKKDKAYAELEKKCNEALQDLDKNPLVSDMRAEIKTLQIEGLRNEGKRLKASEIQILQKVDSLRWDRAAVVSRVIPDTTMMLIHSDEMGALIYRLVKTSIIYGRCTAFEEVAKLKKPFVLEEILGYHPSLKEEYDRAGNDLADASYPFLAELTADPHTSMEQLLSK